MIHFALELGVFAATFAFAGALVSLGIIGFTGLVLTGLFFLISSAFVLCAYIYDRKIDT